MEIFYTHYGKVTLYKNEIYIGNCFRNGKYWEEENLLELKKYINPDTNILEIGGHCGTSSIVYSRFLNKDNKVFVYEPQKNMYKLLVKNIKQNNLEDKIIPFNSGVFCYSGKSKMNDTDVDGGGGIVEKRYNEEKNLGCNFGGLSLGSNGEEIETTTIDEMNLENIGFIHCDAQGSENFIFSKGLETIRKYKPIIYYEDNYNYGREFYDVVVKNYPEYSNESKFDIKNYCMNELNYSKCIEKLNGTIDTLLIP